MSELKIGSLFSGTGALDLAISEVTGATTAFVADVCGDPKTKHWPHRPICKAPCTILAHRFPGVPNLGDVSTIDWTPWAGLIAILCAGFPCQDVSTAGKRAGLKAGTRTGLWSEVVRAIAELQPRLVVLENVPGIFTAPADGDVEPCTWCVGDGPDGYSLHALDAVLADLAEIGFDADWVCVPASGVGAPHRRLRWFLAAYPAGEPWSFEHGGGEPAAYPAGGGWHEGWAEPAGIVGGSDAAVSSSADVALLPSPRTSDTNGVGLHGDGGMDLRTAVTLLPTPTTQDASNNGGPSQFDQNTRPLNTEVLLLPTPAVNDMGKAYTPEERDAWTAKMKAAHGNGNGHGKSLEVEAARLLPTPMVGDGGSNTRSPSALAAGERQISLNDLPRLDFGQYAAAIARWESVIGRLAPSPTEPTGKGGAQRLSPRFTEFMMGLPDGWITNIPGITRNEALKACGNGVVPQQAAAALRHLLATHEVAA